MSLRAPLHKGSTFKTRKRCFTCEGYGHHAYKCSLIKCSKYGEFGHYDYQCPSKSLHIDIVSVNDFDNLRIVEDVHILLRLLVMLMS